MKNARENFNEKGAEGRIDTAIDGTGNGVSGQEWLFPAGIIRSTSRSPESPPNCTFQMRNSVRARNAARRESISSRESPCSRSVLNASTVKEAMALP